MCCMGTFFTHILKKEEWSCSRTSNVLPLWYSVDMERRDLSHKEKLYLREQNVITETQCTLGKKHTSDQIKFYPVVKKHFLPFVHLLCKYCLFMWILIVCVAIKECRMCLYCVSRSDSFAEWRGDRSHDKGVSLQTLRVFSNTARERAPEDS